MSVGQHGGDSQQPAARRRARSHLTRQRATVWVDSTASTDLASVLKAAGVPDQRETRTVYLVGPLPGGSLAGFARWAFDPPERWEAGAHYLDRSADPVLRFVHVESGGTVEIHRGSSWFSKQDGYRASDARQAAAMLLDAIRSEWKHDGLAMLSTPSGWGRDLWLRTIPHGVEYPTLPDDLQRLIRSTSGQGRWQSPGAPGLAEQGPTIPALCTYDMRFGYAGMLSGLGVGPWVHDDRPAWEPYQRGRFRVTGRVPAGWGHVGLVGVKADGGTGWHYPNRPGEPFDAWIDGAELAVLDRHGWAFDVAERIVGQEGKPLDLFRSRMLAVRDALAARWRDDPTVAALAAAAARTIVLHTVGGLHGRGHRVTRTAPSHRTDLIPADGTSGLRDEGGVWVWTEQRPSAWPETSHPEWSTAIWGRCRARIIDHRGTGALHVPFRSVLAIHSDALYLTDDPGWTDDGKVGTLRCEASHVGPLPTPAGRTALIELRDRPVRVRSCGHEPTIWPPDGTAWCAACHPGWPGEREARDYARSALAGAQARNARARVGATGGKA